MTAKQLALFDTQRRPDQTHCSRCDEPLTGRMPALGECLRCNHATAELQLRVGWLAALLHGRLTALQRRQLQAVWRAAYTARNPRTR
jgi:hypothetical protein